MLFFILGMLHASSNRKCEICFTFCVIVAALGWWNFVDFFSIFGFIRTMDLLGENKRTFCKSIYEVAGKKNKKIIKTICGFFFFKDFLIYQITNQKSDLWFIRTMNLLHMGMCCTWEFFLFPSAYEVVCSPKWDVRGERKRHMRDYLKKIYKIKRLF